MAKQVMVAYLKGIVSKEESEVRLKELLSDLDDSPSELTFHLFWSFVTYHIVYPELQ